MALTRYCVVNCHWFILILSLSIYLCLFCHSHRPDARCHHRAAMVRGFAEMRGMDGQSRDKFADFWRKRILCGEAAVSRGFRMGCGGRRRFYRIDRGFGIIEGALDPRRETTSSQKNGWAANRATHGAGRAVILPFTRVGLTARNAV